MSFLRNFLSRRELARIEKREQALALREKELQERIDAFHKWKLVHKYEVGAVATNPVYNTKIEFKIFYYLFETKYGERKFEIVSTHREHKELDQQKLTERFAHFDEYVTVILPWLRGEYNPKIPTFEESKAKDVESALAGERL